MTPIENRPVAEIGVIVHPENVAAAMKSKELALFVVWMTLNAIDKCGTKKDGKFSAESIYRMIQTVLGVKEKQAYAIFNKGVDHYWSTAAVGKDGARNAYVFSLRRVEERLQPFMARAHGVKMLLPQFFADGKGWAHLRQFLFDIVAGRETKPMTKAVLSEQTGLSRTTVKRRLRESPRLHRRVNYAPMFSAPVFEVAHAVAERLNKQSGTRAYRVAPLDGKWHVFKRLANTYLLTEVDRLPIKRRPKELRAFDADVTANSHKRLYEVGKRRTLTPDPGTPRFRADGYRKTAQLGIFGMWKPIDMVLPETVLNRPPVASPRHRYLLTRMAIMQQG